MTFLGAGCAKQHEPKEQLDACLSELLDQGKGRSDLASWRLRELLDQNPQLSLLMTDDQVRGLREAARRDLPGVRHTMVEVFSRCCLPRFDEVLKEALSDPAPVVRGEATIAARRFRYALDPSWFSGIARLTEDADESVRCDALITLGMSQDSRALPLLLAALDDAPPRIVYSAIQGLGKLADPRALQSIRRFLASDQPELAASACQALGNVGEADDVALMIQMLGNRDKEYRAPGSGDTLTLHWAIFGSVRLLSGMQGPMAVARCREWWRSSRKTYDYDDIVRTALAEESRQAWASRRIKRRGMSHLLPAVREQVAKSPFRYHSYALLAWYGDGEAALKLCDLLDSEDQTLRFFAVVKLSEATGKGFFSDGKAWREWLLSHMPSADPGVHDYEKEEAGVSGAAGDTHQNGHERPPSAYSEASADADAKDEP